MRFATNKTWYNETADLFVAKAKGGVYLHHGGITSVISGTPSWGGWGGQPPRFRRPKAAPPDCLAGVSKFHVIWPPKAVRFGKSEGFTPQIKTPEKTQPLQGIKFLP